MCFTRQSSVCSISSSDFTDKAMRTLVRPVFLTKAEQIHFQGELNMPNRERKRKPFRTSLLNFPTSFYQAGIWSGIVLPLRIYNTGSFTGIWDYSLIDYLPFCLHSRINLFPHKGLGVLMDHRYILQTLVYRN